MISFIKEGVEDSVRKMNSLVKDVGFLSESERMTISQWLINISCGLLRRGAGRAQQSTEFLDEIEKKGQILASQDAIDKMKKDLDHLLSEEIL